VSFVAAGDRIQSLGVVNRFYRQGTNKLFKRTWTSYLFRIAVDTISIDSRSESLQPELFRVWGWPLSILKHFVVTLLLLQRATKSCSPG